MAERIIKWFVFSIGLMTFPIILSIIIHASFNVENHFSDYTSELLFMAVSLATTALGDVFSLLQKGVKGLHLTLTFLALIFIAFICIVIYGLQTIASTLSVLCNQSLINLFTIVGCLSSIGIGLFCQVFLEKIEGKNS